MIFENVELHNIEEVRETDGCDGVRLQRVPEDVRTCLNEGARNAMLSPACAEIRFVSDSPVATVTVSSTVEGAPATIFLGDFQTAVRYRLDNDKRTIEIERPEHPVSVQQIRQLDPHFLGVTRQQHPEILQRRPVEAVIEIDEMGAGIRPQDVARVTIAMQAK